MIESLYNAYLSLSSNPDTGIASTGRSIARPVCTLIIDPQGHLNGISPLYSWFQPDPEKNKKIKKFPPRVVPTQYSRASAITPNFLCDNVKYCTGFCQEKWDIELNPTDDKKIIEDAKAKKEKANKCFFATKQLCHDILDFCDSSPEKSAILAYFDTWDPETAETNTFILQNIEDLKTGTLIFRICGHFAQDVPEFMQAWDTYINKQQAAQTGNDFCLLSGTYGVIAKTHPLIKGVRGAQATGAALISYNAKAYCSYDKEQCDNAQISPDAANKYTSALNYFLENRNYHAVMGDITFVYWSNSTESAYSRLFAISTGMASIKDSSELSQDDLTSVVSNIRKGIPMQFDNTQINPETDFHVLGIVPNASRLSIRFSYKNSFGKILENIQAHFDRLSIIKPSFVKSEFISFSDIVKNTMNPHSDKTPPDTLIPSIFDAVLKNTMYPTALLSAIIQRIRSNDSSNMWQKAAIIKAYLIKYYEISNPSNKEVPSMELNEKCTYIPYVLGRLFATLEKIQKDALGDSLSATIKDKYFASSAATPGIVFPSLLKLSGNHLKVIQRAPEKKGFAIADEKKLQSLLSQITTSFPKRLSLEDQGIYILGYYHQTQDFYTKKAQQEVSV